MPRQPAGPDVAGMVELPPSSPPSVIYHTSMCKYCGINWCSNYQRNAHGVERYYSVASSSLQTRGCSGVTSAWPHARNSRTGTVYAVDPVGTSISGYMYTAATNKRTDHLRLRDGYRWQRPLHL